MHHFLEEEVKNIIKVWNENCLHNRVNKRFTLEVCTRDKVIKSSDDSGKINEIKVYISELLLICSTGNLHKLIHRIELGMPKDRAKRMNETQWKNDLYRSFIYECIGTFCVTTNKLFDDKDIAEYDVIKDRLKPMEQYAGISIKVDNAKETDWFKVGEVYEVFTQTNENMWGVYSYKLNHKNGIGGIPLTSAIIIKEDIKKIIPKKSPSPKKKKDVSTN
jgi:hypothetical protein